MKRFIPCIVEVAMPLLFGNVKPAQAQTSSNIPPEVSIVWPRNNCADTWRFQYITCLKIKAVASDPDGTIAQVQFFRDDVLIGTVTNAPFEMIWEAAATLTRPVKAVAFDNFGTNSESAPVAVTFKERGPSVFEIKSPPDGSVFAAPGTFLFSAEQLAVVGGCTARSVEFFAATNLLGVVTQSGPFTVTTPLYSLIVTNLPEGNYELYVRLDMPFYDTVSFAPGACGNPVIRVAKLGVAASRLTAGNQFQFDVVTSFPTNENIIEASSDLLNWTSISTDVPFTNTFTFTDPSPATNAPRFYRAVAPSQ